MKEFSLSVSREPGRLLAVGCQPVGYNHLRVGNMICLGYGFYPSLSIKQAILIFFCKKNPAEAGKLCAEQRKELNRTAVEIVFQPSDDKPDR